MAAKSTRIMKSEKCFIRSLPLSEGLMSSESCAFQNLAFKHI